MAPITVVFVRLLQHLPILLLCSLYILLPAGAQYSNRHELYVKPTEDTPCTCPAEPCYTLDTYVASSTQYFVNNTVFKFLPGNHSLSQSLVVTRVANLALVGMIGLVNITCQSEKPSNPVTLSFNESSDVTLENLSFLSCGTIFWTNLFNLTLLDVSVTTESDPFEINKNWVLKGTNILGTSSFTRLQIIQPTVNVFLCTYTKQSVANVSQPVRSQLTIQDSAISRFEQVSKGKLQFELSSAVSVTFDNFTVEFVSFELAILVKSLVQVSIVMRNSVNKGLESSIAVTEHSSKSNTSIEIDNCSFHDVMLYFDLLRSQVLVQNSLLKGLGPGLTVVGHGHENSRPFLVRNVTFSMIRSFYEEQAHHSDGIIILRKVRSLEFKDCVFHGNVVWSALDITGSVVLLVDAKKIVFTGCSFIDNYGTPITSVDSTFVLSGRNHFKRNSAYEGGVMGFYGRSYVTLAEGLNATFVNNSAETVGGVIYVDHGFNTQCFFKVQGNRSDQIVLSFENNTAKYGGRRIYGAAFDTCKVNSSRSRGWKFASSLFDVNQTEVGRSLITSDPLRVCLCKNNTPVCTEVTKTYHVYPGQKLHISAAVVGDRFGTVAGQVYANAAAHSTTEVTSLGTLENLQRIDRPHCTKLTYTVFSNTKTNVTLTLKAHGLPYRDNDDIDTAIDTYNSRREIKPVLRTYPVNITILFYSCPVGFTLSAGKHPNCTCDTLLQKNDLHCDIAKQEVQRTKTEWVSVSPQNSNSVTLSKHCPYDYCRAEKVDVNLSDPDSVDSQCAFNRSGILCGGCQAGLSLALGSPHCIRCSNDYLALLIPFALVGFALVFFIKLLNLTVAQGTMNSLIFYANIIRANQLEWILNYNTNILTVFIAWLNLDLGIETCFIGGLDAYWKTWLQFVFPLYIWAIVILIIILSRYSSTAAKIFGRNSVPVLATLFLLSYPKLLRTIISIFHISILEYKDGHSLVWSYDGNVPYFSPKHVVLLLLATMVFLVLWLPYTGILLFAQCLQGSGGRLAAFLARLKPFFDAYFGPFRDKHRYWVGLMLLIRGILFVIYAATPLGMASVDLIATAVVVLCLLVYPEIGHIYRKTYLNRLEVSFLLNLGVLSVGTLYIRASSGNQAILAYISIGIAFAQFVAIMLLHVFMVFKATAWGKEWTHNRLSVLRSQGMEQNQLEYKRLLPESSSASRDGVEAQCITYGEFREPVLKYIN